MKATADRYAVAIAYFLIYVVWGSTYYFIGVALEGFPTFLLGALRLFQRGRGSAAFVVPYPWRKSVPSRACPPFCN